MQSATFDEVANQLSGEGLTGNGTVALATRPKPGFFVPPTFFLTDGSDDPNPITLISARGAAGKTTTADALSERLNAPVWRLQDDTTVSHSSVHSLLVQHLSEVDPFAALQNLNHPLMIIDSLDEARARVSATSWTEFIAALAQAHRAGLRLTLLGRTRTVEELWAAFGDLGVPIRWYELSHFGSAEIPIYIDLRTQTKDPRIDIKNAAYLTAKGAITEALMKPLGASHPERFVGYPPVLDAVSQLLIGANHHALANTFQSAQFTGRVQVLEDILQKILSREEEKVKPLRDDLGLTGAYTPAEQLKWLVHDIAGGSKPDLEFIRNEASRVAYEDGIREFVLDHPFRDFNGWASPIFRAYVAARLFDEAPTRLIFDAGEESGLLFELVCESHEDPLILSEAQFAALHASLVSGQGYDSSSVVIVNEENGDFESFFVHGGEDPIAGTLEAVIDTKDSKIFNITGPLTGLSVSTKGTIQISNHGGDVVLGPELSLHADRIFVDGNQVAFGRRNDPSGSADVMLHAESEIVLPSKMLPPFPQPDVLEIMLPAGVSISYPWVKYRSDAPEEIEDVDDRAIRFLAKLMNLTRSHGHSGDRAVFYKKFQGRQGLRPEKFAAAIQVLVDHGVVYLDSDMIYVSGNWEPHRFDGKRTEGQRHLEDCLDVWRLILSDISNVI